MPCASRSHAPSPADCAIIDALRALAGEGTLDLGQDRDYAKIPSILGEIFDTIDARIRKRLDATHGHTVYATLAEQIEKLGQQAGQSATEKHRIPTGAARGRQDRRARRTS